MFYTSNQYLVYKAIYYLILMFQFSCVALFSLDLTHYQPIVSFHSQYLWPYTAMFFQSEMLSSPKSANLCLGLTFYRPSPFLTLSIFAALY